MKHDSIKIRSTENVLIISANTDIGGRKDFPTITQKTAEKRVKDIHDICKGAANYQGTSLQLEEIDWYDSVDSFQVPCASISKGDRKVSDDSEYSNTLPKGWEQFITIRHKATIRNARPLEDAMKALGVYGIDVKDIQKMLKKNNGVAYIAKEEIEPDRWGTEQFGDIKVLAECNY